MKESLGNRLIEKELRCDKQELSREKLELGDGKMCDLVKYDIKGYGFAEYAENIEVSNGSFRRSRSMIPFDYLDANMKKFQWHIYDSDVKIQKKIAESFTDGFHEYQKSGKGLYIFSKTKGSGKTFLACALANEILKNRDICVKFISVPELLEMTKRSYRDFAREENLGGIRTAELLILDDIGAETKKEWVDTELFRLIDYRYSSRKVTIFTSNVAMDMLKLNDRIVDRIYRRSLKLPLPEKAVRSMQADAENMKFMQEILKNAP